MLVGFKLYLCILLMFQVSEQGGDIALVQLKIEFMHVSHLNVVDMLRIVPR